MKKHSAEEATKPEESCQDALTEILRNGARRLLAAALEAEVEAFLQPYGNLITNPGVNAGPGASGGAINLFTGFNTIANNGIIQTNGPGGSLQASGGEITVAVTGPETAQQLLLNNTRISADPRDLQAILPFINLGNATSLTVDNTGTLLASGAPGSGAIYFISNNGSITVNEQISTVPFSTVESSGVINFRAENGDAYLYADRLSGTVNGIALSVYVESQTSGFNVANLVSTAGDTTLVLNGTLNVLSSLNGPVPFAGVLSSNNINIIGQGIADFAVVIAGGAVLEATGTAQPVGFVQLRNTGFGVTSAGGQIIGAVTSPMDGTASGFISVSTDAGVLLLDSNRSSTGSLSFDAKGSHLVIRDTAMLQSQEHVDLSAIGSILLGAGATIDAEQNVGLHTSRLELGALSTITTAGGVVAVDSNSSIDVVLPGSSMSFITLNGGSLNFAPAPGSPLRFTADGGSALLQVDGGTTTAGTVGAGGSIEVAGGVALQSNGNINMSAAADVFSNSGLISATGQFADIRISADRILSNGAITGQALVSLHTNALSSGDIELGADIGGGSLTIVDADGTGSISQTGGRIAGAAVRLSSGTVH